MDRKYAYISVNGTGDTALVTAHFGLQPTTRWNVDDLRANGTKYGFSHWTYESPTFEAVVLDEAILALVNFVEENALNLASLPADFEACLQCVGYHERESPGFHLDRGLLQRIARLGVSLDFDLYCHAERSRSN